MNASIPASSANPSEGELFKKILGPEWQKLHPDIQRRFEKNPAPNQPLYYNGILTELRCSTFGRLLALLTRPLVKGALIPYNDANFPVDIQVYSKPHGAAIFKQRIYRLHGRRPIQFTSYMLESTKGDVLEYVGLGLGMQLELQVQDGCLHFASDGYFWQIFGWRIPLPHLFTPGKTLLWHRNKSPTEFEIRIEIRHQLFGLAFTQAGFFHEIEGPAPQQSVKHSEKVRV